MKISLKEKAYLYIKDKILSCEYKTGYFIDEKILIEELSASRTPIREGLSRLEQEGFVQILPKKGVVVKDINLRDIAEIYQISNKLIPQVNDGAAYGSV